jgi:hypothetical protein
MQKSVSKADQVKRRDIDSDLAAALKSGTAKERPEDVAPQRSPHQETAIHPGSTTASAQINLPSNGLLYDGSLPDGAVMVTSITTREEKLIAGASGDVNDLIDAILNRVMVTKSIPPRDLLLTDRLYILFWVRANSYGPRYGWEITCRGCRKPFRHELKIPGDVEVIDLPDDAREPFEVVLPRSGAKVGYRLLRGFDEAEVLKHVDKMQKLGRSGSGWGDPAYDFRVAHQILYTVPGKLDTSKLQDEADRLFQEGKIRVRDLEEAREFHDSCFSAWVQDGDRVDLEGRSLQNKRMDFVNNLIGMDSQALRDHIDRSDCGFKLQVDLQCPACSTWMLREGIPLTAEFFRPARRSDV